MRAGRGRRGTGSRTSRRQREARRRRIRRRLVILTATALLGALALAPGLRAHLALTIRRGIESAQAFALAQPTQAEVTLPQMQVAALQLGAYDSGERAQSELVRLYAQGVPCVIFQREQMRIVCAVAMSREALEGADAQGHEAYVTQDALSEVVLRVGTDISQLDDVRTLLLLPDALLCTLLEGGETLETTTARTRTLAQAALTAHPEHLLYTQLAQSLVNWCDLMERTQKELGETTAHQYAGVTMYTLCYELRKALMEEAAQSAASTASAQRTPSTAADVMPPA